MPIVFFLNQETFSYFPRYLKIKNKSETLFYIVDEIFHNVFIHQIIIIKINSVTKQHIFIVLEQQTTIVCSVYVL